MRRFFVTILLAVLFLVPFGARADAKGSGGGYVPVGQSAGSQYTEDVPTAGGDTPTQIIRSHPETNVASQRTLDDLNRSRVGAATASLAASLAPQPATSHHRTDSHRRGHRVGARSKQASVARAATSQAAIQAAQTFSGNAGFGTWFFLVLAVILALVSGVGIGRIWAGRRNRR